MLKQKAISAAIWSGADFFLRQGLQFIISIVLARLLTPEEFGTIALLYLFVGLAGAFVDSGFSAALIQRQDITHTDESSVFWFNLVMGALAALGLWLAAPAIAAFFSLPILVPLMAVLALNLFIGAIGSIHATLLTKQLDFRTQLKVGVYAMFVSGAVAIVLAWKGYGVWTLAAQTLVSTIVTTVLLWAFNSWRPACVFSLASIRQLFGYGSYLLAAGMLDIAYKRVYTLLIGKLYGVRDLGFYNRADSTQQMPAGFLSSILARVSFPVFSTLAHDKNQLRRGVQLAVRGMMLVNVPVMLGLAAVAEPLVLTLYGTPWKPVVPLLQVLCLGGIFWPLHVINLNVLMAQGHSHLFFRVEVAKKMLGVILLIAGTIYGVIGIAWSQVVFGALAFFINAYYTKRYLDYGVFAQTRDFLPIFMVAMPMAGSVYWLSSFLDIAPFLKLISLTALGAAIVLGLGLGLRLRALHDAIDMLRWGRPF